jgi:hypothetical protein
MTDRYLVSAPFGGGGSFVQCLLLHNHRQDTEQIAFSKEGMSHDYLHRYWQTCTNGPDIKIKYFYNSWAAHFRINEGCLDPLISFYTGDSYKKVEKIFPDAKYFLCLIEEDDILRLTANQFYKFARHESKRFMEAEIYVKAYYQACAIDTGMRNYLESFSEFNKYEEQKMIEKAAQLLFSNNACLHNNTRLDKIDPERLFKFTYKELINDKEKIISLVEEATKKPRTKVLVESYNEYLERQQWLQDNEMYWLPK